MNVVYFDVGGPNKFLEEYAWWYNKVHCWLCLLCSMLHHCAVVLLAAAWAARTHSSGVVKAWWCSHGAACRCEHAACQGQGLQLARGCLPTLCLVAQPRCCRLLCCLCR